MLKKKFLIASLVAFILFISINIKIKNQPSPPESVKTAGQAVWLIKTAKSLGTGFFISENLFVTNFHVIESVLNEKLFPKTYLRQKNSNQKIKVKRLIALSIYPDLALLETETPAPFYLNLKEVPLHPQEKLFAVGYPKGKFRILKSKGFLKNRGSDLLFSVNHFKLSGASGSPVLNSKGHIAGVIYSFYGDHKGTLAVSVFKDKLQNFIKGSESHSCKKQSLSSCLETALQNIHKKAYQENKAKTQYELSSMYRFGIAVEKNEKTAFYWMKKSAEQAYWEAEFGLAVMYWLGTGVQKNEEKALHWLEKSAKGGFSLAQYKLAKKETGPYNITRILFNGWKKPLSKIFEKNHNKKALLHL